MIIGRPGSIKQEIVEFVRCKNCGKQVDEDEIVCCSNPDIEKITRHVIKVTEKIPVFDKI